MSSGTRGRLRNPPAPQADLAEHHLSLRWEIAVLLITVDEGSHRRGCTKKMFDDH